MNLGRQGHVERAGLVGGDENRRASNVWRLLRELGLDERVTIRIFNEDQDLTIESDKCATGEEAAGSLLADWMRKSEGTPLGKLVRLRRISGGIKIETAEVGANRDGIMLETRIRREK